MLYICCYKYVLFLIMEKVIKILKSLEVANHRKHNMRKPIKQDKILEVYKIHFQ
jgi:hypothetical protein